ncbi:MAG: hypothetical protein ABIR80_14285 [Opitutaceae bacterium]
MPKPHKVEEPAGTYLVSPRKPAKRETKTGESADASVRRIDEKTFRKAADKVFKTHRELLHRLAQ